MRLLRRLFCPHRQLPRLTFCFYLVAGLSVLHASRAEAQVFQLQGGSSTLFRAHGGSLLVRGRHYEGWVGLGEIEQIRFGAFLQTEYRGFTLSIGDRALPLQLPIDLFNTGYYFTARGVGVAWANERSSWYGFGGTSSTGFAAPYFRGARPEKAVAALFADAILTPTLRFATRNLFSDQQTSIHSLEWNPRHGLKAACAAGLGADEGYFSSSLSFEEEWITVKASYVSAGRGFRRLRVQTPILSEVDQENILVELRPKPFLRLTASRNNFLQPTSDRNTGERSTVNQYSAGFQAARFTLNATLFQSLARAHRNVGTSLSVGRNLFDRLSINANLFHSRPRKGPSSTTVVGSLREVLTPRMSLVQFLTHSQGNTTASFGGSFQTNYLALSVEYQTFYVPFAAGNPFKQALVLNLRLHPFGDLEINAGTFVRPDGRVTYTVSGNQFLYRGVEDQGIGAPFAVPRHIVRGRVVDESLRPIRGAALRIDGEMVFTDSQGRFFVRKPRARSYHLTVLEDAFLVPGVFEVISAPSTVTAMTESKSIEVTVVLRRVASTAK